VKWAILYYFISITKNYRFL